MSMNFARAGILERQTAMLNEALNAASRPTGPAPASQGARRREALPSQHIQNSYTCRFISDPYHESPEDYFLVAGEDVAPRAGDVVLAKVVGIHNHKRVETEQSRKAKLFDENLILLAYGHRYAADQFLAHIPDNLDYCHLVAAGGIAGVVTESHANMDDPTLIEPLGLLATDKGIVNIGDYAPYANEPRDSAAESRPEVIAVLGTSMNSGKSTTLACLANGLTKAGKKVGAGKITGTGAGNDRMIYHDAGAAEVIDFTDFGYGSTFKMDFQKLRDLTVNMIDVLSRDNDVVIVEIADGVYQTETARLLRDEIFHASVDQVVFSAVDALGARAGVQTLQEAKLQIACATGVMTASPLATQEADEVLGDLNVPVISTFDLTCPDVATTLLKRD
ncbi:DUF1611 domain-containing protein [Corynebacterium breve]|uniref:DUF1611 domain-containing protein n=1 Tax=Corynebacterium breve TaxID=3049799 RepID=A0ABY8VG90_9CORY|nr:DUF1611 domain-containing protein [Corynebacterium breve]WIM68664.1 DUF1611 domain-containing protein [Corynebacterium breve]